MLGSGFKAERLRVNLRLVINRLKLLEKKKTELAQKARKEIADYLAAGKDERARIRVEHIIREDYLVEAMEILELYCDLLLAELKIVADQLCAKYSKEYGKLCRTNQIGTVNDRLMHKLSVEAPPKILVERYLIEIAKNYNVPYEPDSVVMAEAPPGVETDLIDVGFTDDVKKGGPGRGGSGGFTAPVGGPDGTVPMPMPMPMPSANTPFSYPLPKGPMTLMLIRISLLHRLLVLDPSQKPLQSFLPDLQITMTTLSYQSCHLCQTHYQLHLLVPAPQHLKTLTLMIFPGGLKS
uniref:IST1 homolog n=1 Tax=Homo sapiens TaxID=9606 RepID=B4DM80_HUMAN|nr:unnamed protein product [Homo sapiens]